MTAGFVRGLRDSLSIAIGYVPVAISFGLAAIHADIAPFMAVLFSLMIYAGASQFILVALIAQQTWFLSVVAIICLMNLRHLFYGPALLKAAVPVNRRYPLVFWAAGLTDEVFAAAIGRFSQQPDHEKEGWYLGLQLGAYLSWVGGTAIGAYFGADWLGRSAVLDQSLGFVLPALFFALLLEIAPAVPRVVLVTSMAAAAIALAWLPAYVAIIVGMLAGGVASVALTKK
ncbi:AzlC family ABC transporter permease [Paenalcaligenes niemegkensis]|uniref:AzlC family ABC transporter permease n=1 Tax=Paenalcaligenes niemegkensis TaxID=2895469 RepID=UPI001EE90760|nr:AzlC family ABC transporter permease [Paenalcaligenes niemegkensis]MCQ9616255.1 AzlC family ABC transporter permease [Paenalcaligenes niemegkensis]